MRAENRGRYRSTKFTTLPNADSYGSARKNYFICITIATLFFCVTVVYFSCKSFINSTHDGHQNPQSPTIPTTNHLKFSELKLYNPKPFLSTFGRRTSKDLRELICEESQLSSEAIPAKLVREILQKSYENIQDYIKLDLLIHYESIINKNEATSLMKIFNDYQMTLSSVKSSRDFLNFLKGLKSNKCKFYGNHLKEESLELKNFESFFALTEELSHWYNYLNRLSAFLNGYEQQKEKNCFAKRTEENFEKFTEDTQKRLFHFTYPFSVTEKKLREINGVLKEWTKPVKVVFQNCSIVFYGKVLLLSAINQELRSMNTTCLKSAYFLAGHTVYLDEDVELFGVDLAIIAPNWRFLKKIRINLSGADGKNWSESANTHEHGKPGKPGKNAGNFLGVGDPHGKFLFVSANGGRGGNGQNGAKGRDGANNTRPGPPVGKPTCTVKGFSFRNAFEQVITHYKIYSPSGCGASGKDGGVGGRGGAGGLITLIGRNSTIVKSGLNGASGSPGRGGAGGVGGRNGCFYEVLDVDDEFLHRVSRVNCPSGNVLPSGESGRDNHNARGQVFPPVKENLMVQKCLHHFIGFAGEDSDSGVILLLKQFNQFNANNTSDLKDVLLEYKLLEAVNKIELYDVFYEKLDKYVNHSPLEPALSYLKSIVLARMAALKKNINFSFIDQKNYLNILKGDIKVLNERTRELQSSTYLKRKVDVKREEIKENLKKMKFLLNTRFFKNFHVNCLLTRAIDVLLLLMTQTLDGKHMLSNDRLRSCRWDLDNQNNRESSLKTTMSRVLENFGNKEDIREQLENLKDTFCLAGDSVLLSEGEKNFLVAFTEELEHFVVLCHFDDWERSENLFLKSLRHLPLNINSSDEEVWFLKGRLVDVMLSYEYSLAMDATQQNLYPPSSKNTHLRFFQNKSLLEDFLMQAAEPSHTRTPLCKNHMKAVFDQNSTVGEFYFWPNAEIKNKLRMLFSGAEIDLKSNLINRHVFDKNFIRFTSLKLELECRLNGDVCQEELDGALNDFKIEITHSGYSYYNWEGDTHIGVSEKVSLEYSFRTLDNKEPEIYNALYKKCQDGEIKLSPFTTWIIRLLPINDKADFKKLSPFVDVVNVRLTGTGTYTS